MMSRHTLRVVLVAASAVFMTASATPARAQGARDTTGALLLGPVTLRPAVVLRDAGTDSNIFNEPGVQHADRTARVTGTADAEMRVGLVNVEVTGSADYLYFDRYTRERALNRAVGTRLRPRFTRFQPYVEGAYRRTRDRANSEIDIRAPRTEREFGDGVEAKMTTRAVAEVSLRRADWRFDGGEEFRGIDLATRLDRTSNTIAGAFRYELSPLTRLTVSSALVQDRYRLSPDRDTDAWQSEAGFLFAPDAVIRGRAVVGFRDLRALGTGAVPFRGPTASVELSYSLLDRTVFSGRLVRETTVSIETNPYYLSSLGALDVRHHLTGPVYLMGKVARETLDYDPLPAFGLSGHRDRVTLFGGGVAVQVGPRMRATLEYEDTRRRSDAPVDRAYDRRRLFTTVSYGF